MWQLDNRTPYAVERTWTRGRDGEEIWLVAVRCTFAITADGRAEVAAEQPPVVGVPEYIDPEKPAASSLKYDMDLVRAKVTTDVVVHGHAYAPRGRAVTAVDVGLRVGTLEKRLRVVGDRYWRNGSISAPEPFVRMPIVYERAFGGVDPETRDTSSPQWETRNPVGTGFATSEAALSGMRLPNIEYPDAPIRRWKDRPLPAGLGPVAANWQPRAALCGTYDEAWQQTRFPLLPMDFQDAHYQCAPSDQQTSAFLKGGERVLLRNLTTSGELRFVLPRVLLGFETFFYTGDRQLHDKPSLHTVIIEPDVPSVSLVWHTALSCHPKVYKLKETRIIEKALLTPETAVASIDSMNGSDVRITRYGSHADATDRGTIRRGAGH